MSWVWVPTEGFCDARSRCSLHSTACQYGTGNWKSSALSLRHTSDLAARSSDHSEQLALPNQNRQGLYLFLYEFRRRPARARVFRFAQTAKNSWAHQDPAAVEVHNRRHTRAQQLDMQNIRRWMWQPPRAAHRFGCREP